jgi:hypothetical protein
MAYMRYTSLGCSLLTDLPAIVFGSGYKVQTQNSLHGTGPLGLDMSQRAWWHLVDFEQQGMLELERQHHH